MKRAAVLLAFLAACTTATPPPAPAVNEEIRATIEQLNTAVAEQPTNASLIYYLAAYHDRAKDPENVVKWLTRLDELGWEHGIGRDAFRNTNTPAFHAILAKLKAREPHVHRAATAFTLANQRDLVPEGIAYDPVDDVFYLTSIHRRKVLRVDRNGNARDFTSEGQDGMLVGLGTKVDAERRLLWVISTIGQGMRAWTPGNERAILAAYDLRDGRLVKKIETPGAFLNDLTLLRDGSLFATDTMGHRVMRLAPGADALELWVDGLQYPNGIAVSEDERSLYVADFRGINRFDLADKTRTLIESKALLNGIDGLSVHDGTLIGIQNAIGAPRVVRIHPSDGRVEILESKNPLFELPTTGAVAGNDYFFIANPSLRSFDENNEIWPMDKLEDPVMLRIGLR